MAAGYHRMLEDNSKVGSKSKIAEMGQESKQYFSNTLNPDFIVNQNRRKNEEKVPYGSF
jgi:hypothetical protein